MYLLQLDLLFTQRTYTRSAAYLRNINTHFHSTRKIFSHFILLFKLFFFFVLVVMKEGSGNYGCFSCYLRGVDAVDIIVSAADTTATESISLKLSAT